MVGGLHDLSPDDREKVNAAIASAQANSHAHFALVVVHASDRYRLYPVVWGAGLGFIALGIMAAAFSHIGLPLGFAIASGIFVAASLALEWLPLRLAVVPKRAKHACAHALAHREFGVRILSRLDHQGGVLFFVSTGERYVEIIADHALHQAAGQPAWNGIVADFTAAARQGRIADGFAAGAGACGALLEAHRPKG